MLTAYECDFLRFNVQKTAFGRHETFGLRYGWLTKGYQALQKTKKGNPFTSDDATVELGVGVNMVSSIRYWLVATQIMSQDLQPTDVGRFIFGDKQASGCDPYLEDEATIWLLHWLLVTNPDNATSWYWFFNNFHKPEFNNEELITSLLDWTKATGIKVSLSTIKADASLILRMYSQGKNSGHIPIEETLDSPLSLLRLVSQTASNRSYQSKPLARHNLPIGIFAYAVSQLFKEKGSASVPVEDLMYSRDDLPALGSVFRLTETDMITKLEKMIEYIPNIFEIRETAGIHQLYQLKRVEPFRYLEKHYGYTSKGVAA